MLHKFQYSGCLEREFNPMLIGIDMSKSFDTVDRSRLITQLEEDLLGNPNVEKVKLLFSCTTLALKIGKKVGQTFETNIGIPQGDGLSPKLFIFYLDHALEEVDRIRTRHSDHTYATYSTLLPHMDSYKDRLIEISLLPLPMYIQINNLLLLSKILSKNYDVDMLIVFLFLRIPVPRAVICFSSRGRKRNF